MTYLLSFLAFWLACGFVAAGWLFSFLQSYGGVVGFECHRNRSDAQLAFFLGFIAIARSAAFGHYRHGWRKWW